VYLEIITPDNKVYSGEIKNANFPGTSGPFEILLNHAPMIANLDKGEIVVQSDKGEERFFVDGGTVEVLNNNIIVLAESAGK